MHNIILSCFLQKNCGLPKWNTTIFHPKHPKKDTTRTTHLCFGNPWEPRRLWTLDSDSFVWDEIFHPQCLMTLEKTTRSSTKSKQQQVRKYTIIFIFPSEIELCICSCWVFYRFFVKHSSKYKFTSIWHQLGRSNKQFREKDWNTTSPRIKAIYLPSLKLTVRTPANWWLGFDKFPFGVTGLTGGFTVGFREGKDLDTMSWWARWALNFCRSAFFSFFSMRFLYWPFLEILEGIKHHKDQQNQKMGNDGHATFWAI